MTGCDSNVKAQPRSPSLTALDPPHSLASLAGVSSLESVACVQRVERFVYRETAFKEWL